VSGVDLRVFLVLTGVMASLMALVLFAQARTYPKTIQGMRTWATGQVMAFASTMLFGLQGVLHHALSMGLANLLLVVATGLLMMGTCQHFERPLPRWFLPALVLLPFPFIAWLSGREGYYVHRLLLICGLMAPLFLAHAGVVWRYGRRTFAHRFTFTVLLVLALVMAVRGVTVWVFAPGSSIFDPSLLQGLYLGSFGLGLLLFSIGGILMATERLRTELEHLASKDSLTGALNRRAFFELAENEVARSQRNGQSLSVLALDLDHFKDINDHHGHQVGDRVLVDFVQRAQGMLRRPAIFARFGGEEFITLLPDTDRQEALQAAERIRASATAQAHLPLCHVSIGVATYRPAVGETLSQLINRADKALYRAKAMGRNRVEEAHDFANTVPQVLAAATP
jgi:diguanylate cyclase (GGDEF)-like protein